MSDANEGQGQYEYVGPCHPECFAGLGGELVCLFDNSSVVSDAQDVPTSNEFVIPSATANQDVPTPNNATLDGSNPSNIVLGPSNTLASELSVGIAWGNLGNESPCPHQVGSTPGGAKPPSPLTLELTD